jgi:16S rRNA (guanine527-N7)-methyltransferase
MESALAIPFITEPFTVYSFDVDLATLLRPYIAELSLSALDQVSRYMDLLLRWNAKMNLTSIRDPEQIVTRHFGESFFLAEKLLQVGIFRKAEGSTNVIDVGSGAGFPGIPLKIACPYITLSLIEAQQRKAVFLKEVLRALNLDAEVKNVRAEALLDSLAGSADLVTLRAVEKFEAILPVAARLVRPKGRLALLIGNPQAEKAMDLLKSWHFDQMLPIPGSENRIIALGNHNG